LGEIRKAQAKDIVQIKQLVDEYIGTDFYSVEELENIVQSDSKVIYVYCGDDSNVNGMTYILVDEITNVPELLNISDVDFERLIKIYPDCINQPVGIFKTISVKPECRKTDVADDLVKSNIEWFKGKGVKLAIGEAIVRPDGKVNAARVNEKSGLKSMFRIKKPWSKIKSYCPYCKNEYCQCDAEIFAKEII